MSQIRNGLVELTDEELLQDNGKRIVRSVMQRDGRLRDALINVAAGNREEWTLPDWCDLLRELDRCSLTINQWLENR